MARSLQLLTGSGLKDCMIKPAIVGELINEINNIDSREYRFIKYYLTYHTVLYLAS